MTYPGHAGGAAASPDRGFYGHLDPAPPVPAVRPRRQKRPLTRKRGALAVLIVCAGFGVPGLVAGLDDPAVGDCVTADGSTSFELVECDTAEAQYRIVGAEDDLRSKEDFDAGTDVCAAFPTTGISLWEPIPRSLGGTVYCAEPI